MNLADFPWAEVLALIGIIAGPLAGYLAAKRMTDANVLVANLDAIKKWSEQRQHWEDEISDLHTALAVEQEKRRAEREKYLDQLSRMRGLLRKCTEKLDISADELCPEGDCDDEDLEL